MPSLKIGSVAAPQSTQPMRTAPPPVAAPAGRAATEPVDAFVVARQRTPISSRHRSPGCRRGRWASR